MPAGRPTKYTPELLEKAHAYMNGEWETEYDHAFPSVVGMCVAIGIDKSTAYAWADDETKEFSDILSTLSTIGESVLINKGLKGEHNSNISKLVLGKFGYKDRSESEVSVEMTAEAWLEEMNNRESQPEGA